MSIHSEAEAERPQLSKEIDKALGELLFEVDVDVLNLAIEKIFEIMDSKILRTGGKALSQTDANYRPSSRDDGKRCGACANYLGDNKCSVVDGFINSGFVSDEFEPIQKAIHTEEDRRRRRRRRRNLADIQVKSGESAQFELVVYDKDAGEIVIDRGVIEAGTQGDFYREFWFDGKLLNGRHVATNIPFGSSGSRKWYVSRTPEQEMDNKAAIRSHETSKADVEADWDASSELKKVEGEGQLKGMHAWKDPDKDPDTKGAYKLPHHNANGDVVFSGVSAAMAALNGARSPIDIPDKDKKSVHNHLSRHYGQFDKEPPDLKL